MFVETVLEAGGAISPEGFAVFGGGVWIDEVDGEFIVVHGDQDIARFHFANFAIKRAANLGGPFENCNA